MTQTPRQVFFRKDIASTLDAVKKEIRMDQTPNPDNDIDEILDDFANFCIWESKQVWKPDYDRGANIANSRNRANTRLIRNREIYAAKQQMELLGKISGQLAYDEKDRFKDLDLYVWLWQVQYVALDAQLAKLEGTQPLQQE